MKLYAQLAVWGAIAVGSIASISCTVHGPEVVVGPPPVNYVYDDGYYGRGHWDGNYWAWRDRDGRFYREERVMHEQRMREHVSRDRHEERMDRDRR